MQHNSTEQLHIVVHHIPCDFVTTGHPMISINGFVAFNSDKIMSSSQFSIKICGSNHNFFVFEETASRIFHNGKSFRKSYIQRLFQFFGYFVFNFINLFPNFLSFFQFNVFNAVLQFGNFCSFVAYGRLNLCFQCLCTSTKLVVRQFCDFRINGFYFFHNRIDGFQIALCLVPENFRYYVIKSHILFYSLIC